MKIIKTETISETKWLSLKYKIYLDKNKNEKKWEYVERVNNTKAVIIIPEDRKNNYYILIKQYRLPFENYVIEFPAGLIDKDETIEQTAKREIIEETGFCGEIMSISPLLSTSSGLTTESIYIVKMEIDISKKNNQKLEPSEDIEILILDKNSIKNSLIKYSQQNIIIDSKVWLYFFNNL